MKLFISADIEGCVGTTLASETHKETPEYRQFAKRMTEEVRIVCQAALEAGADEIVVKDGHGDATNIDFTAMPEGVTLIRGKSGHPYNMMFGLDETFDGVLYVGYHAPAGNGGNPISHTSTGNSNQILLNGKVMSEFMLNTYTAAMMGVPAVFISGDEGICGLAREMVPGITTAAVKKGMGACSFIM
ncbi:MAG: M55 family metallopeptidase, partial [Clostridium sp.]